MLPLPLINTGCKNTNRQSGPCANAPAFIWVLECPALPRGMGKTAHMASARSGRGSCEKSHKPTFYGSRLWPYMWPCYAVPGAWPCGGDTGGVTSAVRYEAAGSQQPDRRSCGHGRRDLAIRGGGGEYEGAFPRKRRLETPFVRSTHGPPPVAIAHRAELDVQSRVRLALDSEASRPGGGPVLSAAAACRLLCGPPAPQTPTSIAAQSLL